MNNTLPSIGIITSRKCPTCGHHEVGLTTEDGMFYPLKPGTRIRVLEREPPQKLRSNIPRTHSTGNTSQDADIHPKLKPWVPEPLRGVRSLRLKYGVLVKVGSALQMSGRIYQEAYLEKLKCLIEKEVYTPIPAILDHIFAAPHLASGNPKDIAFSMWQELEEIRQPVVLVKKWLENPTRERINALICPKPTQERVDTPPISDPEAKKELENLSLEEFLRLL